MFKSKFSILETLVQANLKLAKDLRVTEDCLRAANAKLKIYEGLAKDREQVELAEAIKKNGQFRITPYRNYHQDKLMYYIEEQTAPDVYTPRIKNVLSRAEAEKILKECVTGITHYTSKGVLKK